MTVELTDDSTSTITLAGDDAHGGVTDDLLEAAAAAAFAPEATGTSDDEVLEGTDAGEAGATGEGDGREGVPTPSPAPEDDPNLVQLADGIAVPRDELIQWTQFGQFLRENPEYAARVEAALSADESAGGVVAAPSPAGSPPAAASLATPPEGLDLDDPQIKALWDQHVATLNTIERLESNVQHLDQYVQHSQIETTQSLLNTARASYQSANNLSDTEMQTVYDVAGRLQVLPALLSPTDPITGVPREVDPLSAMQEAFDLARWNIPELREREMKLKADEAKADTKRKQKLSSLGGSSGSVPKTTPEPKNAQERRAAMIAEVAAMYNGEGAS